MIDATTQRVSPENAAFLERHAERLRAQADELLAGVTGYLATSIPTLDAAPRARMQAARIALATASNELDALRRELHLRACEAL